MSGIFSVNNCLDYAALDSNGGDVVVHPIFIPNISTEILRSYLAYINTWSAAEKENCKGKVTTENEQHPQSLGALQLDIGVTGIGNSEQ